MRWIRRTLLIALLLPILVWLRLQLDDGAFEGARLDGEALPARDELEQHLKERSQTWDQTTLTIKTGPYVSRLTRSDLGASLDAKTAYQRAARLGRTGNPLADLASYWAHVGDQLNLPWNPSLDHRKLAAAVQLLRQRMERPPVPGTFDADGNVMQGIPGLTINSIGAVARIKRALRDGANEVELAVTTIRPPEPVRYDPYDSNSYREVLQSFQTKYTAYGDSAGRAQNIEIAAQALDGAVLPPGAVLSFNEVVGERSYERGFRGAKELANRRVVDGIGGGVCQVAATLHAAAFLGGMDIVVYQPHSRPVQYIEMGLDTMVSWPNRDLQIRNPYPFPIRIRAVAESNVVNVELLGSGRAHPVEWDKQILERIDAGEKVVAGSDLAPGQQRVVQDPIDGLVVERTRTVYLPTGPDTRVEKLRYPPNPRIVSVGG